MAACFYFRKANVVLEGDVFNCRCSSQPVFARKSFYYANYIMCSEEKQEHFLKLSLYFVHVRTASAIIVLYIFKNSIAAIRKQSCYTNSTLAVKTVAPVTNSQSDESFVSSITRFHFNLGKVVRKNVCSQYYLLLLFGSCLVWTISCRDISSHWLTGRSHFNLNSSTSCSSF